MFARIDAKSIGDLLLPRSGRPRPGVYFARLCFGGRKILDGLWAYHEKARVRGAIIEGQIANPDERQLNYLADTLGTDYACTRDFVAGKMARWMPRMDKARREEFASALCDQLALLQKSGKSESILKNIYCKMMCWLYYRFERLTPFLGDDDPPRVLYEGSSVTAHELTFLRILCSMGTDILLLEPAGDKGYLKQDPESRYSQLLYPAGEPFPQDFSLKRFRKEMQAKAPPAPARTVPAIKPAPRPGPVTPRPAAPARPAAIDPEKYFQAPRQRPCTNAWMKNAAYPEILTPLSQRGDDPRFFYNAYIQVKGAEDKLTYLNDLYRFYQQLKSAGRNVVIQDGELPLPTPEETQRVRRRNYRSAEELIVDLAGNLPACPDAELQKTMQRAFVQVMQKDAGEEENLRRLVVSAVYLLCFIQRYQAALFQGWKGREAPVFILMDGGGRYDALYLSFLSRLPVDVLVLCPDLSRAPAIRDEGLLVLEYGESLDARKFPRDPATLEMRTVAAHAQEDLSQLFYADSGLYRARQFSAGEAITLRTTYDEIFILWDQELKFRPNFSASSQCVNMPVIYAKVSGVEGGSPDAYWQKIKLLLANKHNVFLIPELPFLRSGEPNAFQALAIKALKNGVIRRDVIRESRRDPFALLREDLQEHIYDKLQLMLSQRLIRGTFENGTEYTVIATVLNMKKELLRLIQSFDFTRLNPKLVCVCASDRVASLEDAILFTFLHLIGFDIVLFVPTGYQVIENCLNDFFPVEHQIGEYLYDLKTPDFDALAPAKGRSWLENLWKRGK